MRRSPTMLFSRLPVAECKSRLEAAAESDVPMIADMKLRYGILASVGDNGVRLRVRHAFFRNGISPKLWARFRSTPAGTLIELRIRMNPFGVARAIAVAVIGIAIV